MAPHVLVFGSTGQLARELARAEWAAGTRLTFLDRAAADLRQAMTLAPVVRRHRPDIVIVAAAYTAVDRAESEESLAFAVNAEAPAAIAAAAAKLSIPVIYLSTDYVFDGEKRGRYEEDDPTRPLGAYGRSKRAGEEMVRSANPCHIVLRTSWIFSVHGSNFVRTMLRLAETRDEVRIVGDQRGCPTAAASLAAAIARLVPTLLQPAAPSGTFHLASPSDATWHSFAEAIFSGIAARGGRRPRNLAIPTSDYPTPARRPLNSRLSSRRIGEDLGISLPGWEESLARILDELLRESALREESGAR